MGAEGAPHNHVPLDKDGLAQHIKHISAVEPAPAMLSGQNPDVHVQLVQPGIEELKTPRAQELNGTNAPSSDSGLAPTTDYFSPAARASDTVDPPSPQTGRRQSINLASLSHLPSNISSSPDLATSSQVPQRLESALTRDLAAQRDALAAPDRNISQASDSEGVARLRPQRSLTEYPLNSEPLHQSPDKTSSQFPTQRQRPAALENLRGPSVERQPHTTGNTPLHTPQLFSPRASRPQTRAPYLHTQGTFASPYLHPVQLHQPPKETSKATREVDVYSGRKIINQYEMLEEIGKGTHGKVKLARELETGAYVAIKIVSRYSKKRRLGKPTASQEDTAKKEIAILKKAIHRNVVSMIEVIDDPEIHKIYLVLEFCELHDVKWRTPGASEILLLEHRRLQREKRGDSAYDVQSESDKILRSAVRRRERAARRRAPLSRINSQDNFCWSLEYAEDSGDEEDVQRSESVSGSISRISTRPSIPIPSQPAQSETHSNELDDLSPTNTRFIEPHASDLSEMPNQPQSDVPDVAQSWDMRDLHTHLQQRMAHLEDASDPRGRKASVAESSASHLTEMMEYEIVDEERRYVPLLTLSETRRAFRDALLGLEYLHYQGIVHRDIKPENLLRKADHSVKISDFGVSYLGKPQRDGKESEDTSETESPDQEEEAELAKTVGTPAFYAPELCTLEFTGEKPRVTPQIDVWALGVVLYCLVYARLPFEAANEFVMMRCIAEEEVTFSRQRLRAVDASSRTPGSHSPAFKSPYHRLPHELAYDEVDDDLLDLLKRLFQKDPMKRIQVKEIKHHPWILRDIANPVAWQEETDPARFTQGKKIEISTAEVNDAVIPLKILERAKSVAKKVGGALGLGTSKPSRKRGQSSANSSDVGSVGSSHSPSSSAIFRNNSVHSDDGLVAAKRDSMAQHNHQEHPLSQSVTASPDIEKANLSFEQALASEHASADNFADFKKRPPLAGRQPSSMSTAGSIKTIRQSDIMPKQPDHAIPSPPEPIPHHSHRDILSTASISALFGGAGRSIMRTMSRSRRGSESGSRTSSRPPSPKVRDAHSHAQGHGHGEPSTAISIASAAGTVQQPPRTQPSASPSPDSRRTSIMGGVPSSALPHAVQEAAARRGSPITGSPSIGSPTGSRASPAPADNLADASDAEYTEVLQQMNRRRAIEDAQARERSRPVSALSNMPCPPSPDDEDLPTRMAEPSPASSGFLPLNADTDSPSPRPRERSLVPISSNSSEDRFNSGMSQSTSYPSIPSVVSANSSVQPDDTAYHGHKDESAHSSDGTAGGDWQAVSQGPMATPTGPLVLTEARKQALDRETHSAVRNDQSNDDSDESEDSDEFLVMGKPKKPRVPAVTPGRPSITASQRRTSERRERRPSGGIQESFQP